MRFFSDRLCFPTVYVPQVQKAIGETHISGDFHRIVANDPGK
jgi:hypothetical protein